MNIRLMAAAAAVTALSVAGIRPAHADQSAVNFLQPYVQWAQTKPNGAGTYGLDVVMVSNQPSLLASYSEGAYGSPAYLAFYNSWIVRLGLPPFHSEGFSTDAAGSDAAQYFSDRRWNDNDDGFSFLTYPFSPYATDKLAINLDALSGRLIARLDSWGGAIQTADLHAANGVLIGTIQAVSNPATVVISVREDFRPRIP